MEIKDIKTLKY